MTQSGSIEFCGRLVVYSQNNKTFERKCGATVSVLKQCECCGYCTFDPKPTAAELNVHYQTDYPEASSPHYDFDLEYNRPDLPGVAAHLIQTIRTFGCRAEQLETHDYGCAMGNLVHALRQAGVNATGHDINRDWIEQASSRLGDAVSFLPFGEIFKASPRQLHLVTMLHTLEHMPYPLQALREIRDHLDISGIVYICVPNALFLVAEVFGREADENFLYPTHLHYFTPKSMQCLLRAAGMRLLHVEARPTHLSPQGRDSILAAARQIGLGGEEQAIMSKLASEFRTAELFLIATRDDNDVNIGSSLSGRLNAIAHLEKPAANRTSSWTMAPYIRRRAISFSSLFRSSKA